MRSSLTASNVGGHSTAAVASTKQNGSLNCVDHIGSLDAWQHFTAAEGVYFEVTGKIAETGLAGRLHGVYI